MGSTRKELAKESGRRAGVSGRKALVVQQHFLDVLMERILREGRVELRNFGVFKVVYPSPREVIHPRTGDRYMTYGAPKVTFNSKALKKWLEQELAQRGYDVRPQNIDAFVRGKAMSFESMVTYKMPLAVRPQFMRQVQRLGLRSQPIQLSYVQVFFEDHDQLRALSRLAERFKAQSLTPDFEFSAGVLSGEKFYVPVTEPDDYGEILYSVYNVLKDGSLTYAGKTKRTEIQGKPANSDGDRLEGFGPKPSVKREASVENTPVAAVKVLPTDPESLRALVEDPNTPPNTKRLAQASLDKLTAPKRTFAGPAKKVEQKPARELKPHEIQALKNILADPESDPDHRRAAAEALKNVQREQAQAQLKSSGQRVLYQKDDENYQRPEVQHFDIGVEGPQNTVISGKRPKNNKTTVKGDPQKTQEWTDRLNAVVDQIKDIETFNAATIGPSKREQLPEGSTNEQGREIRSRETNELYTLGKGARGQLKKLNKERKQLEQWLGMTKNQQLPVTPETTRLGDLSDPDLIKWFERNKSWKAASDVATELLMRPKGPDPNYRRWALQYVQKYMASSATGALKRATGKRASPLEPVRSIGEAPTPENTEGSPSIKQIVTEASREYTPPADENSTKTPSTKKLQQKKLSELEDLIQKNQSNVKVLQAIMNELVRRRGSTSKREKIRELKQQIKALKSNYDPESAVQPAESTEEEPAEEPRRRKSRAKPTKRVYPKDAPEVTRSGRTVAQEPYSSKPGGRPFTNTSNDDPNRMNATRLNWIVRFRHPVDAANAWDALRHEGLTVMRPTKNSIIVMNVANLRPYAHLMKNVNTWHPDAWTGGDDTEEDNTPRSAEDRWVDLTVEASSAAGAAAIMSWLARRTPMRYVRPDRTGKFQVKLEQSLAQSFMQFIQAKRVGVVTRRYIIRPLLKRVAQFFKSPAVRQAAATAVVNAVTKKKSGLRPAPGPGKGFKPKPKSGPGFHPAVPMSFNPNRFMRAVKVLGRRNLRAGGRATLRLGRWTLRTASEQGAYAAASFLIAKGAEVVVNGSQIQATGASREDMQEAARRAGGGSVSEMPVAAAFPMLGAGLWAAGKWIAPVVGQWLILQFLDRAAAAAAASDLAKKGVDATVNGSTVKVTAPNPAASAAAQQVAQRRKGRIVKRDNINKNVAADFGSAMYNTMRGVQKASRIAVGAYVLWHAGKYYKNVMRLRAQRHLLRDMTTAGLRVEIQSPQVWAVQGDIRPFLGRLEALGVAGVRPLATETSA